MTAGFEDFFKNVHELIVLQSPLRFYQHVGWRLGHEALYGDVGAQCVDYVGAQSGIILRSKCLYIIKFAACACGSQRRVA